ncbi:MAG: Hsp70 family protein, partial [Clostridiales Family XIII bacterium]|nr:Hsp70 family protein [Clostridiales Family XIII bacterium]
MNYIGIDLGTTNSVIASFNGKKTRVWKSPEQNDVTPSAIVIGDHGQRYYGRRAYDNIFRYPYDSATLFKRMLGTKQVIHFKNANTDMTPEECSAEILRV